MKRVQHSSYGNPSDVVEVVEAEPSEPAEGEAQIAVEASPIRFQDLYTIRGSEHFRRSLPDCPGGIGIGRITKVGHAVTNVKPGDRVYLRQVNGTWQDRTVVPAAGLHRAPDSGDPIQLSVVNSNLITAYGLMKCVVDLEPGEWVLLNAANSNCGHVAIQLARTWGVKTVCVVRRASLAPGLQSLGADAVVVDGPNLAEDVARMTGEAKIRLGLDMVAGDATGRLAECMAKWGTIACYGQVSGDPCSVPAHLMLFKQLNVVGFLTLAWLAHKGYRQEDVSAVLDELGALVLDGKLVSPIAGVYSFAEARQALDHAARSGEGRAGKVILVPHT